MDECLLYDLIECSVCLERLDGSSKVLPCQHTFCKPCLEEIVLSRKELRCPECRILVETKVDDLPCNILLIRILDGMKNAPRNQTPTLVPTQTTTTTTTVHQSSPPKVEEQHKQGNPWRPPYARALYAYDARESGDLQFKKGDVIVLRKKVDQNWFQGELGDKQGYVPASYVQVISVQPPPHVPQCRALYDFKMNDSNEKDCLGFAKGEIVTVIRRIDENWAEGKLKDRIGIFPISFVEMNSPARSLMKLSTNLNPGPSRVAPPTPSSDSDTTPLITTSCAQGAQGAPQPTVACTSLSSSSSSSSSNSSASTSSTATSTSNSTSSSANSAPSTPSPVSPPRVRGHPSTGAVAEAAAAPQPPLPWSPQYREKRHSLTAVPSPPLLLQGQPAAPVLVTVPQAAQHRRSLEILDGRGGTNEQSANRCGQSPWRSEGSPTQNAQQTQGPQSISLYVALYAYKPQKEDELELRKGELYTVVEKCQDGWFKGASLVGRRAGVFPGNYVQLAKSQGGAPELPPRVLGNGAPAQAAAAARSVSQSWDGTCSQDSLCQPPPPRLPCQPQGSAMQVAAQPPPRGVTSAACEVTPPNVTVVPSQHLWDKCSDKAWSSPPAHKDRKEKEGLGLMKRFAGKKKCKSPPLPSAYSMDNPVFVDCAAVTVLSPHSRSESCPSEAAFDGGPAHKKTNSLDVDGDKESAKCQHAKYPAPLVRERFRCIVPYPPNSEYELELRVGDIIYVHKKREDGWFKGTLQRTGKTGLFPGSFVETF